MTPEMQVSGQRDRPRHREEPENAAGAAVVLARDPEEGKAGREGSRKQQPDDDVGEGGHGAKLPETSRGS